MSARESTRRIGWQVGKAQLFESALDLTQAAIRRIDSGGTSAELAVEVEYVLTKLQEWANDYAAIVEREQPFGLADLSDDVELRLRDDIACGQTSRELENALAMWQTCDLLLGAYRFYRITVPVPAVALIRMHMRTQELQAAYLAELPDSVLAKVQKATRRGTT